MIHEDYGFYSYAEYYVLGDVFVLTSPDKEKGTLLELKGKGCRQMESYLLAQHRSWYDFLMDALVEGGVMKRLDLAINDMAGILDIPELTEKCNREECISVFRSFKSYRNGFWYPFIKDAKRGMQVQYHLSLAHSLAVWEFRKAKEEGYVREDAKIGLINCFAPPYTREDPTPEDLEALRMEDGINNRWWLDLVAEGHLPEDVLSTLEEKGLAPERRPGDEEILKQGKVDWLGFNYYHPSRIQAPKEKTDENGYPKFSDPYVWPEAKMNIYRGWEIYPKGIYDFGMKMKNEYPDLKFFVSENGMGVEHEDRFRDASGEIQDDYRIEFITEHLQWIFKSIEDGAKCLGYHYWGVIDNWSWNNAFKNRYGMIEVDLMGNYSRKLKKSARWMKGLLEEREAKV